MKFQKLSAANFIGYVIQRLPSLLDVLSVYAVIVFFVYSWMLFVSFYKFPSWILYLTIDQILVVYAYSFSVNLFESIFVLAVILLLDWTIFFLLKKKDEFTARSIVLSVFVLASMMWRLLLFQDYQNASVFVSGETLWWTATILLAVPSAVLISKSARARNVIGSIAERATVFLYIYLPLSFISLAVIGIRNLR